MGSLEGTKTEQNLKKAFEGESQARNRYTFYAEKAKEDGYMQIADIFMETANNEKEHAEIWYKVLHGCVGSTMENLMNAVAGENFEWTDMYVQFAKDAREEGFTKIANLFERVGCIEREHEDRFKKLIRNLKNGMVFSKDEYVIWQCMNCGHICIGKKAPQVCPVCSYPQGYYKVKCNNL